MELTAEQKKILDKIKEKDCKLLKVEAVAGAGKTHMLIEIAKELKVTNGLYISYNKSIADEATEKFPSGMDCRTIHSLAYSFTVRNFGLKVVSNIKARIIKEKIPVLRKSFLLEVLKNYFLSRHTTIQEYVNEFYQDVITESETELLKQYFIKMKNGEIECTHDFYLKLFHILLRHRVLKPKKYDLLALDESGDITGVSLEIFRFLDADKKIMTGDSQQNIYSFNQTINGFLALKDEGYSLPLTMSYRVSSSISPYIENFCNKFLDGRMEFKGLDYKEEPNKENLVTAYIARTNAGIIMRMIELDQMKTKYNITRKVNDIFSLPLLLMSLYKDQTREIISPEYRFLEEDMRDLLTKEENIEKFKGDVFKFLEYTHSDDIAIMNSILLIKRFGRSVIYDEYKNALEHEKERKKHKTVITSAHSSKGHTFDIIYIEDDMNEALNKIVKNQANKVNDQIEIDKTKMGSEWKYDPIKYEIFDKNYPNMNLLTNSQIEEFRLYYVACTRTRYQYHNAKWLEKSDGFTDFSMILNRGAF